MYVGVDPQQDQALIERHGVTQRLEHRSVEADQGESFQPMPAERLEGERRVMLERSQRRSEVDRPVLQADEAQHRQDVGQHLFVARRSVRPARSLPAGSARISGRTLG